VSTNVNPDKLRPPENMSAAVVAKCHAENQCILIDDELKKLRAKRRAWNRRLGVCLRSMSKFATESRS